MPASHHMGYQIEACTIVIPAYHDCCVFLVAIALRFCTRRIGLTCVAMSGDRRVSKSLHVLTSSYPGPPFSNFPQYSCQTLSAQHPSCTFATCVMAFEMNGVFVTKTLRVTTRGPHEHLSRQPAIQPPRNHLHSPVRSACPPSAGFRVDFSATPRSDRTI